MEYFDSFPQLHPHVHMIEILVVVFKGRNLWFWKSTLTQARDQRYYANGSHNVWWNYSSVTEVKSFLDIPDQMWDPSWHVQNLGQIALFHAKVPIPTHNRSNSSHFGMQTELIVKRGKELIGMKQNQRMVSWIVHQLIIHIPHRNREAEVTVDSVSVTKFCYGHSTGTKVIDLLCITDRRWFASF